MANNKCQIEEVVRKQAEIKSMSTNGLWDYTHDALSCGQLSRARMLLDELGLRNDVRDLLSSAESYNVPQELYAIIQDRIDLVNSKVRI